VGRPLRRAPQGPPYPAFDRAPGALAVFPAPQPHTPEGFVVSTAAMDANLLLAAYSQGIFPWSEAPVRWYSPTPRAVFLPQSVHLPRNLGKLCRRGGFEVSFDGAFSAVMHHCQQAHGRANQWIGPAFVEAYGALHRMGFAHSVEVWQAQRLVGGLYGVHLGDLFAGESMFHLVDNAAKAAFAGLLHELDAQGVRLMDAQVLNDNSDRLGAFEVARQTYLQVLQHLVPPQQLLQPRRWGRSGEAAAPI
ncbi:MAG: leucyl/phenylalanyl-tRNA--protein transferase, partial [Deltaproteobacteria bacterium]